MAVIELLMKRMDVAADARARPLRVAPTDYPVAYRGESLLSETLAAAYDPSGAYAEALRTLRSQLLMRWRGKHASTLAIVSGRAGEGCSALAANLAIVFAQLGERTVLVDANLRKPSQHHLFGLGACLGMSELLNGVCSTDEALQDIAQFDCLSVLCAGAPPPNPQELLSRSPFNHLLEELRGCFDVVIIDTPPLLEYADAQIITAGVQDCLIGARRHSSRLADIARVKLQLNASSTQTLGAVISD